MDQAEAPVDIRKQWQAARANRRMQFKVGNYRDGDRESNIRMLTGTIKADWIQFFLSSCRARSRLRRSSKRFVLDWQFPHVGEKVRRKARCLQYKTGEQAKNNTTHNKPKQPKKTPRKLRETLRFQKVPKPLSTASRCYSKSHSNIPSDSIS